MPTRLQKRHFFFFSFNIGNRLTNRESSDFAFGAYAIVTWLNIDMHT